MRTILIYTIVLVAVPALAQKWQKTNYSSFVREYSNLLEAQPKEMYNVRITTSVFQQASDAVPTVTQQSVLKVYKANDYAFQSESTLQIQNGKLRIDVDTAEQQVVLSNGVSSDLLGFKKGQFDKIDSTQYRFYTCTEGSKRLLKVEEINPVSSMQTVCFEFNKTDNRISRLEMIYWPANFTMSSLDDQSIEQPKVTMEYSGYSTLLNEDDLKKFFEKWVVKETSQQYSCPRQGYSFHNLLETKR